jgi:hypothetical protein
MAGLGQLSAGTETATFQPDLFILYLMELLQLRLYSIE